MNRIIPLISISQTAVNVTFATYDPGYDEFLVTGDDSKAPSLEMNEHGPFMLETSSNFRKLSVLMLAFIRYLEKNTTDDD